MASISPTLFISFFIAFHFFSRPTLSAKSPANPPSIPPQPPADQISPSPSPATASPMPSPATSISSPPATPPSDIAPMSPSPAPSPHEAAAAREKTPSPAPAVVGDASLENDPNAADLRTKGQSSGGMNGGHKAAVAIGVIGVACVAGAGALVYKKRQQNIRRSQYGRAARRDIL